MTGLIDRRPFVRRTYVRTPGVISGSITAWHVRRFVAALDEAGIPDSSLIQPRYATDTRHMVELSAYMEETLTLDDEVDPLAAGDKEQR